LLQARPSPAAVGTGATYGAKALLENTDKRKTELFKQTVRQLNLAVCFACPVVHNETLPGPHSDFRIQGAVSVKIGAIRARNDADAKYVQVLFTTADEMAQAQQTAQRTNLLDDRNKELLLLVRRLICTHSPFYRPLFSIEMAIKTDHQARVLSAV